MLRKGWAGYTFSVVIVHFEPKIENTFFSISDFKNFTLYLHSIDDKAHREHKINTSRTMLQSIYWVYLVY